MEVRASLNGASVSKTFIAAILVLVAMGLGAMGGYVAKGIGASGTPAAATQQQVHPAAGTVLRQDSPAQSATQDASAKPVRGGTRGDHGELP